MRAALTFFAKGKTLGLRPKPCQGLRAPGPRKGAVGLACRLGRFAACVPLARAHPLDPVSVFGRAVGVGPCLAAVRYSRKLSLYYSEPSGSL